MSAIHPYFQRSKCFAAVLLLALELPFATPAFAVTSAADKRTIIKDYEAARDVIVRHIDRLVPALAERAHPQETLQGVIAEIDEKNDRLSLWLASDDKSEFKVQDGLIFNAIHDGDPVEITVEHIGGAKTIVGLKKL